MANNKAFKVKNGLELSGIDTSSITGTTKDIFVYDTSKDTDGGAWRFRTESTSWYQEGAGTYRGERKEFPALALIVLYDNDCYIYDADDPSLPMWMRFTHSDSGTTLFGRGNINGTSVWMQNGVLAIGTDDGGSSYGTLTLTNFPKDEGYVVFYDTYKWNTGIAKRNSQSGNNYLHDGNGIVNDYVLDVAMTVRPTDEPDPATGLPYPTVVVGTRGGVSVAKYDTHTDRLFIHNKTGGVYHDVQPFGDFYIAQNSGDACSIVRWEDKGTTISYQVGDRRYNGNTATGYYPYLPANGSRWTTLTDGAMASRGGSTGLTLWKEWPNTKLGRSTLQAVIKEDHNTGWMPGDIELATLSDNDTTDLSGGNLVTNGDFANGTTGWTASRGATLSVTSGVLKVTPDGTQYGAGAAAPITCVVGKKYAVTGTCVTEGNTAQLRVSTSTSVVNAIATVAFDGDNSTKTAFFTATATTHYVIFEENNNLAANFSTFDNMIAFEQVEDRSRHNQGLEVNGSITKGKVLPNADLVYYSGWSASNYLSAPRTNRFDFGTDDFSIMFWIRILSAGDTNILTYNTSKDGATNPTNGFYIWGYGGYLKANLAGSTMTEQNADSPISASSNAPWEHVVLTRRDGGCIYYRNGVRQKSFVQNRGYVGAAGYRLFVGEGYYGGYSQRMALLRLTNEGVTDEQAKFIYNQEKQLFREGAQATLYGSDNSVVGMDFDSLTGELHAGTSAGRSVFKGLERVDNTTVAVGRDIAAEGGLVADD